VISVAASLVQAHPRTLRIYEDEGLLAPARTPTNIRLYSENDIRRILWIRRLTQERGVNLAGVKLLFELEERLGTRLLEALSPRQWLATRRPQCWRKPAKRPTAPVLPKQPKQTAGTPAKLSCRASRPNDRSHV
jgi:MerR family transcriptional regulator/heat shock protein HspR